MGLKLQKNNNDYIIQLHRPEGITLSNILPEIQNKFEHQPSEIPGIISLGFPLV